MKQKYILAGALTAIIVAIPALSFGETAKDMRSERPAANAIKEREEKNASTTSMRNKVAKALLKSRQENAVKMLNKTLAQFENIANRIDSRIKKEKDKGTDVTAAENAMTEVRTRIALVKTDIDAITVTNDFTLPPAKIREALQLFKTQVEKTKKDLQDARKSLVEAITAIKSSDGKRGDHATSTKVKEHSDDNGQSH